MLLAPQHGQIKAQEDTVHSCWKPHPRSAGMPGWAFKIKHLTKQENFAGTMIRWRACLTELAGQLMCQSCQPRGRVRGSHPRSSEDAAVQQAGHALCAAGLRAMGGCAWRLGLRFSVGYDRFRESKTEIPLYRNFDRNFGPK
jgi:hypothetical protein